MSQQPVDSIEDRYGPQVSGETGLKRLCRLQQSWYRVERLGETKCGPYDPGKCVVGSALVNGRTSGKNFLNQTTFAYAKEQLAAAEANPQITIKPYRLFNNMLSSQPMCFNLFGHLRAGVKRKDAGAGDVLKAMLRDSPINVVDAVEVEHLPMPIDDYIKDKTAFDASIRFRNPNGASCIATIETKYTDEFGKNSAREVSYQVGLMENWQLCTNDGLEYFKAHGIPQVARNLLLTLAYQRKHDLAYAVNFVVGLRDDRGAENDVNALRDKLAPAYRDRLQILPLEEIVERGLTTAKESHADVLKMFRERYLELDIARRLLDRTSRGD
ncbi:MAG: hypothetical protein A2289_23845 [Deltaproteobacteria bacterium RIFOXYA12_FULL_58_15]|nr:MAG: hypothetical protein A2289_23845 [Deltaproteobacteria bacterium RIFOXYA12_FULL_58_15]